ncbi:MAG: hypothetical protein MRY83_00700 [Flavobacteriales bacterium]|nr:hypothetical protein [Flavobacteriales bacterium]
MDEWIRFYESSSIFSDSFKKELNKQLTNAFKKRFQLSTDISELGYSIEISFDYSVNKSINNIQDDLKLRGNQGFMFLNAQIAMPIPEIYKITIGWKSPSFNDISKVHQLEELPKDLSIFFCNDLPKERIFCFLKLFGKFEKGEENLAFPFTVYSWAYPNMFILTEGDFDISEAKPVIDKLFNDYDSNGDICHCTGLVENNGLKGIRLNYHQNRYDGALLMSRMDELLDIMKSISKEKIAKKIDSVKIYAQH